VLRAARTELRLGLATNTACNDLVRRKPRSNGWDVLWTIGMVYSTPMKKRSDMRKTKGTGCRLTKSATSATVKVTKTGGAEPDFSFTVVFLSEWVFSALAGELRFRGRSLEFDIAIVVVASSSVREKMKIKYPLSSQFSVSVVVCNVDKLPMEFREWCTT
jgi:hypothetical protein